MFTIEQISDLSDPIYKGYAKSPIEKRRLSFDMTFEESPPLVKTYDENAAKELVKLLSSVNEVDNVSYQVVAI